MHSLHTRLQITVMQRHFMKCTGISEMLICYSGTPLSGFLLFQYQNHSISRKSKQNIYMLLFAQQITCCFTFLQQCILFFNAEYFLQTIQQHFYNFHFIHPRWCILSIISNLTIIVCTLLRLTGSETQQSTDVTTK
jgi:hypothetical protein